MASQTPTEWRDVTFRWLGTVQGQRRADDWFVGEATGNSLWAGRTIPFSADFFVSFIRRRCHIRKRHCDPDHDEYSGHTIEYTAEMQFASDNHVLIIAKDAPITLQLDLTPTGTLPANAFRVLEHLIGHI